MHSDDFDSTEFIASEPYMQDDVTWCVSRAKPTPRWQNILYIPKDTLTYTSGGIMYIITIFGAYIFTTFEERPVDFFRCAILSVLTLTGQSSTFNPKRMCLRYLSVYFTFVSFWLVQFFGAFLLTYLSSVLYESQISTINEIRYRGFQLAGNPSVLEYLGEKNMVNLL